MVRITSVFAAAAVLGASSVLAHPGHDVSVEARERAEYYASVPAQKRSLAHCAEKLKARGHEARSIARREALAQQLRQKRSIKRDNYLKARDLATVLATDHQSNLTGITADTDSSVLFGDNSTCVLTPEVTQGPYYVSGELVRQDITDDQEGVPLTVDIQVIDVNTCEPLPEVYLEFWHCNSTGVYSGVVASGNGDSSDETNVDKTFLRGIQPSDSNGVLTFDTIFPGHYTSRATHVHVLAHLNSTLLANNTISGGTVSHVGQMFFDQDLISQVETVAPYSTNTQQLTTNAEDSILSEEAAGGVDPVVEYVLLGDDISEGVMAWISFAMDSTASYTIKAAATYSSEGGSMNSDSGSGSGSGSPPSGSPPSGGNGTAPTGAAPSGAIPSGAIPSDVASSAVSSAAASSTAVPEEAVDECS